MDSLGTTQYKEVVATGRGTGKELHEVVNVVTEVKMTESNFEEVSSNDLLSRYSQARQRLEKRIVGVEEIVDEHQARIEESVESSSPSLGLSTGQLSSSGSQIREERGVVRSLVHSLSLSQITFSELEMTECTSSSSTISHIDLSEDSIK